MCCNKLQIIKIYIDKEFQQTRTNIHDRDEDEDTDDDDDDDEEQKKKRKEEEKHELASEKWMDGCVWLRPKEAKLAEVELKSTRS